MMNKICGWTLSASKPGSGKSVLTTAQFQAGFVKDLISFVDDKRLANFSELQSEMTFAGHLPVVLNDKNRRPLCCVCKLEENWQTKTDNVKDEQGKNIRSQKYLCKCQNCASKLLAYNILVDHDLKIFMFPEFENMSCFEMAHSTVYRGLFCPMNKSDDHMSYSVATSHPLYLHLRAIFYLLLKRQKNGENIMRTRLYRDCNKIQNTKNESSTRNDCNVGQSQVERETTTDELGEENVFSYAVKYFCTYFNFINLNCGPYNFTLDQGISLG